MSEPLSLKKSHPTGLRGILKNFTWRKMFLKPPFLFSILLAVSWCYLTFNIRDNNYVDLLKLVDFNIAIFPSLLGFNLGGYALLIGFGNIALIKSMTESQEGKASIFQKLSAIFAFSILLQATVLILAIVIRYFTDIGLSFEVQDITAATFNIALYFLLAFFSLWAIFLLPYVITNLFTFGQLHHFYLTIEKMKEIKEDENKNSIK